MLISKRYIDSKTLLAIWEISETEEELLAILPQNIQQDILDTISGLKSKSRKLEILASRILLYSIIGRYIPIVKNAKGKPFLKDNSLNISISHTSNYVCVITHKERNIGIDIEKISNKIKTVKHKFISDREHIDEKNEIFHLLLHWSGKESVFKLLNKDNIELKNDIIVSPFIIKNKGEMDVVYNNYIYKTVYEIHPHFVITWAIDKKNNGENSSLFSPLNI